MNEWIKVGDVVQVDFEHIDRIKGILICINDEENCQTEYLIKDNAGQICQVMHYSSMQKL